ncbi:Vesicle transport protein USE1 [Bienertia sinuspersici]
MQEIFEETSTKSSPQTIEEVKVASPPGLRKRPVPSSFAEDRSSVDAGTDSSPLVKLDAAAESHIDKHRKLQEDLTDEMVGMARQLKESSLLMSRSLQNAEKDHDVLLNLLLLV